MSGLLRLYPRRWRDRYGPELEDLVASRPPSLRDRLDLVLGAVDAWLHPELVPATDGSSAHDDRLVGGGPALAAIAALLGGALAIAGSLLMNAARPGPWGYRDEPLAVALIVLGVGVTAVAAVAAATPSQVGPARTMLGLASLSIFGWPLLVIGIWGYVVAAVVYAVKGRDRGTSILVGLGAILLPLMNLEDARVLVVVPFGLAWIAVGLLGLRTATLVGAPE